MLVGPTALIRVPCLEVVAKKIVERRQKERAELSLGRVRPFEPCPAKDVSKKILRHIFRIAPLVSQTANVSINRVPVVPAESFAGELRSLVSAGASPDCAPVRRSETALMEICQSRGIVHDRQTREYTPDFSSQKAQKKADLSAPTTGRAQNPNCSDRSTFSFSVDGRAAALPCRRRALPRAWRPRWAMFPRALWPIRVRMRKCCPSISE